VATDEHIAKLAALAAASLPTGRRVWFEFSNELWNNSSAYLPQYRAAESEGRKFGKDQGWGSGHLQAKALKVFEEAWLKAGRTDDELINVVTGFARSPDYNAKVLEGAKAVSPKIAETLAITNYFGAGVTQELYALPYGQGNPGTPVYLQARDIIRRAIRLEFETWKANAGLCRTWGIPLIAYEGGSHILASGFGDWSNPAHAAFMTFLANLHKHPVMGDLYLEHWEFWAAAGGKTASMFVDIGSYGFYGYWGAKEDVTESLERAPRWAAAQTFARLQNGIRGIEDPLGAKPQFQGIAPVRAEVGVPIALTIAATGGDAPLTSSVLAGALPPGVSASPTIEGGLLLQGTPSISDDYRFLVRVTDRDGDPDYGIVEVIVDPKGTSKGGFLLFNPKELPAASLAKSENREAYRTRFDFVDSKPLIEDDVKTGPRVYIPFDGKHPLFSRHYIDSSLTLAPSSPFALSGGLSLTLDRDEFYKANPANGGRAGSLVLDRKKTTTLLWFGLRDRTLAGWLGSSLDLKPDATHTQERRFGVPTRFDALLIWRRDQFEVPVGKTVAFGSGEDQASLIMESDGIGADEVKWRFVVRQKDSQMNTKYYISEAVWKETAAGRFTLSDFNNNPAPGKRWALINPQPASFGMPPDKDLVFQPVDFTQVDGIGIALQSYRSGWHYSLGISRFIVLGKK
jgi:hypothetical protein